MNAHGGKRIGSGRKKTQGGHTSIKIKKTTVCKLKEKQGKTWDEKIDGLLK